MGGRGKVDGLGDDVREERGVGGEERWAGCWVGRGGRLSM